jgi:hypothetical protein
MINRDDIGLFDNGVWTGNQENWNTMNGDIYSGGAGVSFGGGSGISTTPVGISNDPKYAGTVNENKIFILNVEANETAQIFLNGNNTLSSTTNTIKISYAELQKHGIQEITVYKDGYTSNEKYIVKIVENSNYNNNILLDNNIFTWNGSIGLYPIYQTPVYTSEKPYKLEITYYSNGQIVPFYYNQDEQIISLKFNNLTKTISVIPIDTEIANSKVTINFDGVKNSVRIITNDTDTAFLDSGTTTINSKFGIVHKIASSDITKYRITSIRVYKSNAISKEIIAKDDLESVSTIFEVDADAYKIDIKSEVTRDYNTTGNPIIDFINTDARIYNINSKADIPIGVYKNTAVSKVTAYVANSTYVFDSPNVESGTIGIIIPANTFEKIGNYKIILVPSNKYGDGDKIEKSISVVSDVYVGVPDIRNITYPSELYGPDYSGINVEFDISYDSINTDYVNIHVENSTSFIQEKASGKVTLNFKDLIESNNIQPTETDNVIVLTLKLVPYNISGYEVVSGKTEILTIKFHKSSFTIPRSTAINRLAAGFISQFDESVFDDSISKYLNHYLHLGNGNNKVVTTWTGSNNSLILKLYEPLPTTVQPNDLVWISKLVANPIIERITLTNNILLECPPLKGPNFLLDKANNEIGFQIYDELIASGSNTSNQLINKYTNSLGIDTDKLGINYEDGVDYLWNNFVHFSSAEERVNNFVYKVQLIESYKLKYNDLIASGSILNTNYTGSYYVSTDAKTTLNKINDLVNGFDGFENHLYTVSSSLSYPKEIGYDILKNNVGTVLANSESIPVTFWYDGIIKSANAYDKFNVNYLANNVPVYIKENVDNSDFVTFLDMIGQHFDIIWSYINSFKNAKILEQKQVNGISDEFVSELLKSFGWDNKKAFNSKLLWEYAFGQYEDGTQKYGMSLEAANNQVWRRILNNLPYLLKHKGTGRAMKAIMACYGVPQSMLTIMEFGGPQDPVDGGITQFTFDDRTAAISLDDNSSIVVPWKVVPTTSEYPTTIEFRIKPSTIPTKATLVSGSEWTLDLVQTTGSFGRLELNFGGNDSTSTYFATSGTNIPYVTSSIIYAYGPDYKTGSLEFPISTEYYSNVAINRHNSSGTGSWYEVWLGTSDGHRMITSVSMSIVYNDNQWESGSNILIGGEGYTGDIDEFRLWKVPLQRSKFDNHTRFPDAINGNSYTASTSDLLYRLDFEYPKDRTLDNNIKNVAISTQYSEPYAFAQNFYSASAYPYQYTPYDRTVTADVPSIGFTYGNKIRFESQQLVSDLSYKHRATKKSFDRAPIDSNRLGIFFSPIKELNMDILKAFGDFNIDNYIGDPGDEYKTAYSELDNLRHYYFERLDRNINEYIKLVKYIDKSLFDVLHDMAPARARVSKGLLIEPHFLERSKTQWKPLVAKHEDFETSIDTHENYDLNADVNNLDIHLDAQEVAVFDFDYNKLETEIIADETYYLSAKPAYYNGEIYGGLTASLVADVPMYDAFIQIPSGSTLSGEVDSFKVQQIGMDRNSLANLGYGLYAQKGNGIVRNYDSVNGNTLPTGSRSSIFLVKEQYTKNVYTQTGGYPTNGAMPGDRVVYENIPNTYYKYKVSVLPFSGSVSLGNGIVDVTALNGYFPTHYKYVNNLSEGMHRVFHKGSKQELIDGVWTTPDSLPAVQTFTSNPNILRVAKTGRGSGEPILEVD